MTIDEQSFYTHSHSFCYFIEIHFNAMKNKQKKMLRYDQKCHAQGNDSDRSNPQSSYKKEIDFKVTL